MKAKPEKFDISSILSSVPVSESDTGRKQIEYIDIDLIEGDPRNFYELRDVPALAENIELLGLQQPLLVRDGEGGKVIIVSGHRRHAALLSLVQEGKEQFRSVPCIRETAPGSEALQELRLIYANSDTRRMTSAEISKAVERVEALLYQLKEEGFEFPGRMRDHVAQACKVSATKIAQLKVIRERLSPDFMPDFEKGSLPEQTAYTLARLPLDFQHRIFKVASCNDIKGYVLDGVLKKYEEGWRWTPTIKCPDGRACTHGDAALRHDLEYSYGHCGGNKCCLECEEAKQNYSPCDRMCSKAKAQRKEVKAEAEAKEAKRQKKQNEKYQKETQINAQRIIPAIDAAGLGDDDVVRWDYYGSLFVKEIRKYAAGDFENSGSWYGAKLCPSDLHHPLDAAKKLGCSADFLLGLTDEPKLASAAAPQEGEQVYLAGWMPGGTRPGHSCFVVAEFDLGANKTKMLCYYDSDRGQLLFKSAGETVNMEPLRWIALPD